MRGWLLAFESGLQGLGPVGEVVEGLRVGGVEMERGDGDGLGEDGGVVGVLFGVFIDSLFGEPVVGAAFGVAAFLEMVAGDFFRLAGEEHFAIPFFRNIDVEENLIGQRLAQDEFGDVAGDARGGGEIGGGVLGAEGEGAGGDVMESAFAGGADGARVVGVFAEVGAKVDAGEEQVGRLGKKFVKGDDDAIGGSAFDGPFVFAAFVADDGSAQGEGLRGAALFAVGGDNAEPGPGAEGGGEGGEAGGVVAVVVGEEDVGRFLGRLGHC